MSERKKAEDFAKEQKEISVSEFFEKNKHLLGFDNPTKSLLMAVKEAVDNSLDAAQEAGILPDVSVKIKQKDENTYIVSVADNGPGIVKENVPRVFGKLLYGSKFHRLMQSLTADEPIIIEADGKCKIIPIGEFIDKFLDCEGEADVSHAAIKVPCFDWENHEYKFRNVSRLIKHKRRNEIIRIKTRYNKEIKVTGCHSLFTLDKETMIVKEAAARDLKIGDIIVAPKKLPEPQHLTEICLLDYITEEAAKKSWWYLYLPKSSVNSIFSKAEIIHKKMPGDKSRKYYRFTYEGETAYILDDSYKQYSGKGFIPVWLAKFLLKAGILKISQIEDSVIRSYYHGRPYDIAAIWPLTPLLMKFLGLFVAEGHTDKRQVAITVNVSENNLVKIATDFAIQYGVNAVIEKRPRNAIRVKLFGGLLSAVLRELCGRGAKNKHAPDFVFSANPEFRQHFIDYMYLGDGHNTKERNQLMHSTVSERLSRELSYLWLMQGVQASISKKTSKGYSNSTSFVTTVYGEDIKKSLEFKPNRNSTRAAKRKEYSPHFWAQMHGLGHKINDFKQYERLFAALNPSKTYPHNKIALIINNPKPESNGMVVLTEEGVKVAKALENLRKFEKSDLVAVEIVEKDVINEGHEYVYDISVPEGENFVGGSGGIACHNSRGQQGIGISSVTLYAQLTTGVPTKVWSKIESKKKTYYCELHLNTAKNEPDIIKEEEIDKEVVGEHGVKVEMEIHGRYRKTVEDYLKQTSISNPFAKIAYTAPDGTKTIFPRSLNELPKPPKRMKPHPHGMEFGILQRILQNTSSRTLQSFLTNEFSSVGQQSAKEICRLAKLPEDSKPQELDRAAIEKLIKGMQTAKVQRPPTDCLSPIGSAELEKSLKKEYPDAEFVTSITRDPEVYRGFPFLIEIGIVYGLEQEQTKKQKFDDDERKEETIELIRFANRVPLLYQQSACALTEAVKDVDWRRYNLQQSGNNIPSGPMKLVIHICSVWVPFMSESKEAVAAYPEIIKEAKLAIQDAGRKLSSYLSGKRRAGEQHRRMQMFDRYAGEVSAALSILTGKSEKDIEKKLKALVESRIHIKEEFEEASEKETPKIEDKKTKK